MEQSPQQHFNYFPLIVIPLFEHTIQSIVTYHIGLTQHVLPFLPAQ